MSIKKILTFIYLIRVHQWVKNFFIFIPAFFGGVIFQFALFGDLLAGFIAFSFTASAIYVLNDWLDVEKDRLHPTKKNRPIAAGLVSNTEVAIVFLALLGLAGVLAAQLSGVFIIILTAYFGLNIFYSIWWKHIAIIDISCVALGFLLRVLAGGVIAGVVISQWLVVMTFLLALLLALGKRYDDLVLSEKEGKTMRKVLEGYNRAFIVSSMILVSGIIIVAYLMYTLSADIQIRIGQKPLYVSAFFVILGILRYLQVAMVLEGSGDPTKLLTKDPFIFFTVLTWAVYNFYLLYF